MAAGEPVALLLDQGSAFIAAMLGVLKAGGCFVPLDPANPPGRNLQMLQESGARILMTSTEHLELAGSMSGGCCEILDVESIPPGNDGNPGVSIAADSLAVILFTSGSTGKSKGVMHDHQTLVHNAMRHREAFQITPEDRQTLLYTCSVYGGIRDILNALLCGASLHTFAVKQRGVESLARWIIDSRITIYCSVATVYRQFVATLTSREQFPDLRLIKVGGEASHRADIELFRAHFPRSCRLHCGFGSTETGVARHFFVDHDTQFEGEAVPLGYPVDDVEVVLLDEQGKPVASGEIGEMVVRSRYITRGYWKRPDLNDAVCGHDPADPSIRIYRTGDLGVLRADGCLEHRGRKDFQVKIRGNRIELAEIETALSGLAGVAHAVVAARRDQREENYLVAYIVARGEKPISVGDLRRGLAEKLPEHMIPTAFVPMESLPQTPNGKIDRQALPSVDSSRPHLGNAYVAPQSKLEIHLTALWSKLLGIGQVGTQDDFFELGGNSLTAVKLMAQIRADHGRILPLSLLFEARTVARLAEVIARGHESSAWSHIVPIQPRGQRTPLFCVHPGGGNVLGYQEFVAFLHKDQPVYGIQAHGVVEGQTPHTDIPEMARAYIQAMRDIQPRGPYYLGGESFGGLVAYEMACQLSEAGETVAFLFLGDAWSQAAPQAHRWRYRVSVLTYPFTLSWGDWKRLARRKLGLDGEFQTPARRYVYADELHRRNSLAHRKASRNYRPGKFPGALTLFRAQERHHGTRRLQHFFGGAHMGWQELAAEVEVYWMPDVHHEMMHGPNAAGFAHRLQECIDRARGSVQPLERPDFRPAAATRPPSEGVATSSTPVSIAECRSQLAASLSDLV